MVWRELRDKMAFATGNFGRIFATLEVPPLPRAAVRLVEKFAQEAVEVSEIARIISSDTGLTAKILMTVNSAHFGLARSVTDIGHAVTLLGLDKIRSIALGYAAAGALPKASCGFDSRRFWQDSLQRAVFAHSLVQHLKWSNEDDAFTGALLQNLAQPILLSQWSRLYLPVIKTSEETGEDLPIVEDRELSWNHAQSGAWVARNWGFPDILVCCVGLHHSDLEELEELGLAGTPVMAVAVSARLEAAEAICLEYLELSRDAYSHVLRDTDESCTELAQLFNVPSPDPLSDEEGLPD